MNTGNVRGILVGNYCMTGHNFRYLFPRADPGFQVRRGALKFFWGVFRVKNHNFTTGHRHPPGSAPSFPRYYIVMRAERPILLRFF
jgi:hypothetical protein